MRLLIQRVEEASVKINDSISGKIGKGALVFFAAHKEDDPSKTEWLCQKLINLRIFSDEAGKMNLSLKDVNGELLVVSQFTLYGNCMNGRRPDFFESAPPKLAEKLYNKFISEVRDSLGKVETGEFGAYMKVSLTNDGPVTFLLER